MNFGKILMHGLSWLFIYSKLPCEDKKHLRQFWIWHDQYHKYSTTENYDFSVTSCIKIFILRQKSFLLWFRLFA